MPSTVIKLGSRRTSSAGCRQRPQMCSIPTPSSTALEMGEFVPNLQTAKLATSIAALSVLWALETMAPMFAERTKRLRHDARNLAFGLLNAILVAIPFSGAIVWVTTRAAEQGLGLLHQIDMPVALAESAL